MSLFSLVPITTCRDLFRIVSAELPAEAIDARSSFRMPVAAVQASASHRSHNSSCCGIALRSRLSPILPHLKVNHVDSEMML